MTNKTRILKDVLWFFAFWGLVAGAFRMWYGLGATTNLSDAMPWGLWKIANMVAGVALSTSGFTIGFLVYVLRLERFRPLVKPAILIAFLGYGSSCAALLFDIGLPHRFWHPILMWNEHSFLFEVFWCVMIYFTVTAIELSPTVLERLRLGKLAHWLHGISFGVVVLGISLSSLHHSSLGSLFLVSPQRLHPLWYSPLLPLFFIISAMGAGMMFLVFARILYAWLYDPEPVFGPEPAEGTACVLKLADAPPRVRGPRGTAMPMLERLSIIAASILGLYLVLKVADLARLGTLATLADGTWESALLIIELALSAIIPLALVAVPATRRSPAGLAAAGGSAAAGLVLNRVDVGIFGYFRDAGAVYIPSLAEWALSLGVVAGGGLAFLYAVEYLPIFDERWKMGQVSRGMFRSSFEKLSHVWQAALSSPLHRVTFLAVLTLPVAWIALYPPFAGGSMIEVQPSVGLDAARTHLRIDGNRAGVRTDFPHLAHQQRLGGEQSCVRCHHISCPGDNSTPCSRCHRDLVLETVIFDHEGHTRQVARAESLGGWYPENRSCDKCHPASGPKTEGNARACAKCHEEDMKLPTDLAPDTDLSRACGFQEAMHQTCIPCHREEAQRTGKASLETCGNCHETLKSRQDVLVAGGNSNADDSPAL